MITEDYLAAVPDDVRLQIELEKIFMPYARSRRDALYARGGRFVHYTSAEAAIKIVRTKRLWMRNTNCMADFRELWHGFDLLKSVLCDADAGGVFIKALDTCAPNAAAEGIRAFDDWWRSTQFNTYIACVSEHDDDEDQDGRLSMWRAFGSGTASVALVFRVPPYSGGAGKMNAIFSPVAYLQKQEVHDQITGIASNIRASADFLRSIGRASVVFTVFAMLMDAVICLKHSGFREEREWRVIYRPDRGRSPLVEVASEVIAGIPQTVHKLPLDRGVSEELADLDISRMCDRVIIGPNRYPSVLYEAFVAALTDSGVQNAAQRVHVSNIPIRT